MSECSGRENKGKAGRRPRHRKDMQDEPGAGQACGPDPDCPCDVEADQCLCFQDMAYVFKYLYGIFYNYPSMLTLLF